MKSSGTILAIVLFLHIGCSSSQSGAGSTEPVSVDAIKPPDLILARGVAFYSRDTSLFYGHSTVDSEGLTTIQDSVPFKEVPYAIERGHPHCPEEARSRPLSGEVWVRMLVDSRGVVRFAEITKSSDPLFDPYCLIAAMQFRFSPAIGGRGDPVPFHVSMPFKFKCG